MAGIASAVVGGMIDCMEINEFFGKLDPTWNPLPEGSRAAVLRNSDKTIVAITAAYPIYAAGGSWVEPSLRHNGLSRITRCMLEKFLKDKGATVYISLPRTKEECQIFASYGGTVTERIAQVKGL